MKKPTAFLLACFTLPALAHPGEHHANMMATLWHLVTEPDHLALAAIAIIVGIGVARTLRRCAQQRGKHHDPR